MPTPTDVLNDDVKELKADCRDIRSSLEVLRADVHRIDVSLEGLNAEFRIAKWLVGLLLVATFGGIGNGIWQMATLTNEVKHLASEVADLRKTFDGHRLVQETAVKQEGKPPSMAIPGPGPVPTNERK